MTWKQSLLARSGSLTMFTALLFAASLQAAAQSEWVVHTFPGNESQGYEPMGNLVADSAGNLYGTAFEGGAHGEWGVVYELVRPVPPKTAWMVSVLYSFAGSPDGGQPEAGVIFDKAGNLYGTTTRGGPSDKGTVFELSPPITAGGKWTESMLHSFQGGIGDGASPQAGLVIDSVGNLYGATLGGGAYEQGACFNSILAGCGTVFQLSPPATSDGAWTETILHSFNSGQGNYPRGTPIFDAKGDLYGTAEVGGLYGAGVVYRLAPPATSGGAWTYRVLHAFHPAFDSTDGAEPLGALTLHGKGILYGTTIFGGGASGQGTVFELVPPAVASGKWTENTLYIFPIGGIGDYGYRPSSNVTFDSAGNIYSTTTFDGDGLCGCGIVFKLTPPASAGAYWTETTLHGFPATSKDGATPSGGLILGKNGVLYGVTQSAGVGGGAGAVYGVAK